MPGIKKGAKKLEGEKVNENAQVLMAVATLTANIDHIHNNLKSMNEKFDNFSKVPEKIVEINEGVKRAHEKIDEMKKEFDKDLKAVKDEICSDINNLESQIEKDMEKEFKNRDEKMVAEFKNRDENFKEFKEKDTWWKRALVISILGLIIDRVKDLF